MIDVSDVTAGVLAGSSMVYGVRVESWLGDQLLDDDVPINAGNEDFDRSLRVPERVILSVPKTYNGVSYAPIADNAPLAANGQRLRVQIGVSGRGTETEWVQRGWFLIQDAETSGDTVQVTAVGLLAMVDEAKLVSPYQPSGTIGSTLRGLCEPALTVDLTGAPTDRSVPAAMNIDDDRLQGVLDLLDAWAAEAAVDNTGVYTVSAATQSTSPLLTLSREGTVVRASGASTREGGYNVVLARGTASDGGQIQGVAYDYSGPKRYGGSFNPLPVPYVFSSPLITTVKQCNDAAATVLARNRRRNAQLYKVEAVPDPRLQLGDVVALDADGYTIAAASIETIKLPYKSDSGSMTLGIRSLV